MGRGKVELKRIENKISRQVTFSKRRSGLLKKANEISVLCDADVALIVFSTKGKLYQYSSHSNMDNIIERYERDSCMDKNPTKISEQKEDWCVELPKLLSRIELLQRNIRNCMGEDLDNLSLRELQSLQHQLDTGLKRVRTRKNQLMIESISQLQKKERSLQDQNNLLGKQMKQKGKQQIVEHTEEGGLAQTSTSILPNPTQPSLITCGGAHSSNGVEDGSNFQALPPKLNNHIPPWLFRHLSQL